MSNISLYKVTAAPKAINTVKDDISAKRTLIEAKLTAKCKEYDSWVEIKEKAEINDFKVRAWQMINAIKAEIEDLKSTLASFYKKVS